MSDLVKVQGHEGLRKDLRTKAVVNTDETAFEKALRLKEQRLKELNRVEELETKVERLESLIEKLLEGK